MTDRPGEPHDADQEADTGGEPETASDSDAPAEHEPTDTGSTDTGSTDTGPIEITELSPPPESTPATEVASPLEPPAAVSPVAEPVEPVPPHAEQPGDVPVVPLGVPPESPRRRWPSSARAWVTALAVLTVLAIAAAVIGFVLYSSASDDVDEAEAERDAALAQVDGLEAEVERLGTDSGQLVDERDAALSERDAAVAERDAAVAEAEVERAGLEAELEEAAATIQNLEDLLGEVAGQFPLEISVDLGTVDAAGNYAMSLTEVACAGLESCGTVPSVGTATLARDANQTLRLVVPDRLDAPLVASAGSMFGIADSEGLVPPCGDTPRPTTTRVVLFSDGSEVAADLGVSVVRLGASITIDVPAVDGCDAATVWYHAGLDRTG